MRYTIVDLLPMILGAAVVPLYSVAALLFLQSERGLLKAVAFVAGGVAVRLVQGIVIALVIGAACKEYPEPGPNLIVSTLLLVIGILLLVTAYKQWGKQGDSDAPTPQWMSTVKGLSPLKAVGAGALFPVIAVKQWVFTLSAIGVIAESGPGGAGDVGVYLVYVLATQMFVLAPIVMSTVAPNWAAKRLGGIQSWLERNNRSIVIGMSLVFGVWFLFKGISGLIG
jgi:hypothetical protein